MALQDVVEQNSFGTEIVQIVREGGREMDVSLQHAAGGSCQMK